MAEHLELDGGHLFSLSALSRPTDRARPGEPLEESLAAVELEALDHMNTNVHQAAAQRH